MFKMNLLFHILSYVTSMAIVGVDCGKISCHSCESLIDVKGLGKLTSLNCNCTEQHCDDKSEFCSISAQYKNSTTVVYKERCALHHLCDNTSRHLQERNAYLYCCYKNWCNEYEKATKNIQEGFAKITGMFTTSMNLSTVSGTTASSKPSTPGLKATGMFNTSMNLSNVSGTTARSKLSNSGLKATGMFNTSMNLSNVSGTTTPSKPSNSGLKATTACFASFTMLLIVTSEILC